MFNLLSPPIKKETAESWAKILDDIAKVSLFALPVIFYGNATTGVKIFNIIILISLIYCALIGSKLIRNKYFKE